MIPYKQRLFLEKKAVKSKSRKRTKKRKEESNEGEYANPNTDKIEYNKPYKKRTFVFPPKWGMGEGQYLTPNVGTFNEMMDMVVGNQRGQGKKIIIIYPGYFKPFHLKHAKIVNELKSKYPIAEVFVATKDDSDFNYVDKLKTILASGIDPKMTVKTAKLLEVPEVVNKYSKEHTVVIFAVTKNVMGNKLKPGKYVQKFETIDKCKPISEHVYVMEVPGVTPNSNLIRQKYKTANEGEKKQIIVDLYGTYKPEIEKLFNKKF